MKENRKWSRILIGGILVLVLALGIGTALAQSGDDDGAVTPESVPGDSNGLPAPEAFRHGMRGFDGMRGAGGEALADALGITVEELQAAEETARAAAIEQAVVDGLLTQEQADALLANGLGHRGFPPGAEHETFLAEALGISVEELQAARDEVQAARLAEMVAAGVITQEQADLMLARKAVQDYVDTDALQATLQAAYEEAVAQALADDVITQEQADALLNSRTFDLGGMRGFGGPRGHHGRSPGFGSEGFRGFGVAPQSAPTTDSGSSA